MTDAEEQRARFERWIEKRSRAGDATPDPDERFLAALAAGHPPASGIALGVDRLFSLTLGESDLRRTLPFPDEV